VLLSRSGLGLNRVRVGCGLSAGLTRRGQLVTPRESSRFSLGREAPPPPSSPPSLRAGHPPRRPARRPPYPPSAVRASHPTAVRAGGPPRRPRRPFQPLPLHPGDCSDFAPSVPLRPSLPPSLPAHFKSIPSHLLFPS